MLSLVILISIISSTFICCNHMLQRHIRLVFGRYKGMWKPERNHWNPGTWVLIWARVLSENCPMNTNMTGFGLFSKNLCSLVLWTKVASALERLSTSILPIGVVFLQPKGLILFLIWSSFSICCVEICNFINVESVILYAKGCDSR